MGCPGGLPLLTSREVRNFQKEMNSLTEDPIRGAEQLDQFVEPNFLSGMAMMFLMGMLFTGEEEVQFGGQLCKSGKGVQKKGRVLWGGGERKDPEDKLSWLLSLSL